MLIVIDGIDHLTWLDAFKGTGILLETLMDGMRSQKEMGGVVKIMFTTTGDTDLLKSAGVMLQTVTVTPTCHGRRNNQTVEISFE
jgi:hypothetical protein